ncbi:MAG: DedA family protein [Bacteroidaceae bacterium]|nr:DedA family protein [Bacteroidaceae bacterium]
MLLESTVIPVPSELVVAPAAYYAAGGNLNVVLVVLVATIGADIGASINYVVARYVGRPVVYKFANSKLGHMCLLNEEKVKKSEEYFDKHGVAATLTGRLIPGIRHLISLPAGLTKMNYWKFLLYTTIGAGAWHAILAAMGWYLHSIVPEDKLNETIEKYNTYIIAGIIAVVAIVIVFFVVKHKKSKKRKDADNQC